MDNGRINNERQSFRNLYAWYTLALKYLSYYKANLAGQFKIEYDQFLFQNIRQIAELMTPSVNTDITIDILSLNHSLLLETISNINLITSQQDQGAEAQLQHIIATLRWFSEQHVDWFMNNQLRAVKTSNQLLKLLSEF